LVSGILKQALMILTKTPATPKMAAPVMKF
jgi:hypothetical protein